MVYVALLRGINVGGNNKVAMLELKKIFATTGLKNVTTYINSGNIVFREPEDRPAPELSTLLEAAIEAKFGFFVKVLLISMPRFKKVIESLPAAWQNNQTEKTDILFLWEEVDSPKVINSLKLAEGIDEVRYTRGAILWNINRRFATRSGLNKLAGTPLYKQVTIRNCNSVRKIYELMQAA